MAWPQHLGTQLRARELGEASRRTPSESLLLRQRCSRLTLSKQRTFSSPHAGGVVWLALDGTEQRYLLSCSTDATIAAHDTHALGDLPPHGHHQGLEPIFVVGHQHPGAHSYMVSSVAWYPQDTGLFVSGGQDQHVKLWDTNTLDVVLQWAMPAKVSGVALSHLGGATGCLAAASCHDVLLRLCDLRTGAIAHTLVGHRHPVWCVAWSARNDFELMSGDAHGQVLVWDVRRFGPVRVLDQYQVRDDHASSREAGAGQGGAQAHRAAQHQQAAEQPREGRGRGVPGASKGKEADASAVTLAWEAFEAQRAALLGGRAPGGAGLAPAPTRAQTLPRRIKIARPGQGPPQQQTQGGIAPPAHPTRAQLGKRTRRSGAGRQQSQSGQEHASEEEDRVHAAAAARRARLGARDVLFRSAAALSQLPRQHQLLQQRRPLSASAPIRPHRTGEVIGGRAPPTGLQLPAHHNSWAGGSVAGVRRVGHGAQRSTQGAAAQHDPGSGGEAATGRAHQGAVTCVLPTPDGLCLLTAGTDSRLRLWDAMRWHRQLAGYADTFNHALRARQLGLTQDGRVVFHPTGSSVQVFDVHRAALLADLSGGHTESINACVWSPVLGDLYTGANDSRITVWQVAGTHHQELQRRAYAGGGGSGSSSTEEDDA